jgi:hypothetical protein
LFLCILDLQGFVLETEGLVSIGEGIDLLVEHIHVSEKVVVLLLAFDEGVLDLLNVG